MAGNLLLQIALVLREFLALCFYWNHTGRGTMIDTALHWIMGWGLQVFNTDDAAD